MKYPKVIFIGGAPMIGKTTVAHILASRLRYGLISTDDIGAGISAVTTSESHPAFHYMERCDLYEYYINHGNDELIRDINTQHEALWPALLKLFLDHSTWGAAAIIEGWALRPDYVIGLSGEIGGVFLLADDHLLKERIRGSDFAEGVSDRDAIIEKYLTRSLWYNERIRRQVDHFSLKRLEISLDMQPEEIADACLLTLATDE